MESPPLESQNYLLRIVAQLGSSLKPRTVTGKMQLLRRRNVSFKSVGQLKVLTYNTWLLPFFAQDLAIRRSCLVAQVAQVDADILALQEVWQRADRQMIICDFAKRGYRYSLHNSGRARGLRGWLGNGLLLLSKYPMRVGSPPLHFDDYTEGKEFFASKGCLHAVIDLPKLGAIDFFNTHFGSLAWLALKKEFCRQHELRHGRQLKQFIDYVADRGKNKVRILAGDFNFHPGTEPSSCYAQIESKLKVQSTFSWNQPLRFPTPTFDYQNPYLRKFQKLGIPSQHLDYIFLSREAEKITPTESALVLTESNVQPTGQPLSDHYGVLTTFFIDA